MAHITTIQLNRILPKMNASQNFIHFRPGQTFFPGSLSPSLSFSLSVSSADSYALSGFILYYTYLLPFAFILVTLTNLLGHKIIQIMGKSTIIWIRMIHIVSIWTSFCPRSNFDSVTLFPPVYRVSFTTLSQPKSKHSGQMYANWFWRHTHAPT